MSDLFGMTSADYERIKERRETWRIAPNDVTGSIHEVIVFRDQLLLACDNGVFAVQSGLIEHICKYDLPPKDAGDG